MAEHEQTFPDSRSAAVSIRAAVEPGKTAGTGVAIPIT
jgi:hypothetical protein